MKKVIITGANGFIGRHLLKRLLFENVEIFAIARNSILLDELSDGQNKIKWIIGDLYQEPELIIKELSTGGGYDCCYHFAWTGVATSVKNNYDEQIKNITIGMNVLTICKEVKCNRIIFPGSTNEYLYYGKPLNKNAVPSPNNTYGAVKIALRYLGSDYAARNNIEFVYTIIAGIYAADRRDNNVIFYTIDKLLRGEKPLLTECKQLWDYVYVDDVIDALIAVGEKGKGGAVYAVGHGDNWELSNYIRIIHEKIDSSLPLGIGEIPYGSDKLPCSCIDLTDIENDTGFKPQVDFEEGITRVIRKIQSEMKEDEINI